MGPVTVFRSCVALSPVQHRGVQVPPFQSCVSWLNFYFMLYQILSQYKNLSMQFTFLVLVLVLALFSPRISPFCSQPTSLCNASLQILAACCHILPPRTNELARLQPAAYTQISICSACSFALCFSEILPVCVEINGQNPSFPLACEMKPAAHHYSGAG